MIKGTDCLCFLGDSITEGVGTAKRYIDYIAEETGAEVHGYGVNGAQSVDLFAQIGRMQKETDGCFDILFVCIGTNDYNAGVPLGEFFTEAAETVVCGYDGNGNAVKTALRKKRSFVFDEHTFKGRLNNLFAFLLFKRKLRGIFPSFPPVSPQGQSGPEGFLLYRKIP